jgi:hypothetical protein
VPAFAVLPQQEFSAAASAVVPQQGAPAAGEGAGAAGGLPQQPPAGAWVSLMVSSLS